MQWHQTPSRKKKAVALTTDAERLSGSTKLWIFQKYVYWKIYISAI